jgi:iron complex transport system permease protein
LKRRCIYIRKILAKFINAHKNWILIILPFLLGVYSLTLGKYPISLPELILVIKEKITALDYGLPPAMDTVIFEVRLPRILAAILVGGALSVAGSAYQGIFNNPLTSPDILGATAGASFGAAVAILKSWSVLPIQIASFLAGLAAVGVTCAISSRIRQSNQVLVLVLTGLLTGTVFNSLVSLAKYTADPYNKLPSISFWLMGSLNSIIIRDVMFLTIACVLSLIPLYLMRWNLNVLTFGDEEAQTLGVETRKTRLFVILFSTLLTGSCVAITGAIGWVGLIVPHLARLLVGSDYQRLLPASFFIGATFLLTVDTAARVLFPAEVPLGILTSLIGAPFYIYLLARSRRVWR